MDMDKFIKEVEAKSQKLWETNGVFGDNPEPGVKLFRNFPLPDIKMDDDLDLERLISYSKKEFCADYNRLTGASVILRSDAEPLPCPSMKQPHGVLPTSIEQAIEEYSADALRLALAHACDRSHVDPGLLYNTARRAILTINREILWISRHVVGAQEADSCFRRGPPSCFADRVFSNEINIVVNRTKQNYLACMYREALHLSTSHLQDARDWYRESCGDQGMNCDLLWRFVDVKIRLIAPICPHYAEYVWRELLNNEGFAVTAGWPSPDAPDDPILQSANNYLRDVIDCKKFRNRQPQKPSYVRRSASSSLNANNKKPRIVGLIYVREEYVGWEAECLRMLQENFDSDSSTFSDQLDDSVIVKALLSRSSSISDDQSEDRKLNYKIFLDFLNRKKMKAVKLGAQALDFKMPFGEIEVLQENLDLIRRLIGVKEVLVLSATNAEDLAKVGSHHKWIEKIYSPSPGIPTLVFLTCEEEMEHLRVWESDKGSDTSVNDNDKSPTSLASLYRPPFKLMFQGSFEEAKHAASIQHKWLLVNLQSQKEFSSHLLNRDTWANETVSQIILSSFIFWQDYDDTAEGRNVCTYYKLERMPVVLIIDPITGQTLHGWNQMVQPECLLEDLLPLLESHPGEYHF